MYKRKKTGLLLLAAITVLLSWAWPGLNGKAEAATFTDTITWDGGEKIFDYYQYDHVLEELSPPGIDINSAEIIITYGKNVSPVELWHICSEDSDGKEIFIGNLPGNSTGSEQLEVTFPLTDELIEIMMDEDPWSLTFCIYDSTPNKDKIKLYSSTLTGEYTPVPIPGSALLLGSGVLCLVVIGRRRRGTKKE